MRSSTSVRRDFFSVYLPEKEKQKGYVDKSDGMLTQQYQFRGLSRSEQEVGAAETRRSV